MKIFNLKCENEEHIFNISIEAENIEKAYDLAKEYLSEYKLDPIGLWEV